MNLLSNASLFIFNSQLMIVQFIRPSAKDIIDIAIVWFILYQMIVLVKKIGGYQILIGLSLLAVFFLVATYLQLEMILSIIGILRDYWLLFIVILFQQELRSGLTKISKTNILDAFKKLPKESAYAPLINAISTMAFLKKGAIIVLEKTFDLTKYMETGEPINANLSSKLITSIFDKGSVLHDGAIIIRKERIAAAKVVLPLSQNIEYKRQFGTRHLAAIGIATETDALAIVVSEETGRVSYVLSGVIKTDVNVAELTQVVLEHVK